MSRHVALAEVASTRTAPLSDMEIVSEGVLGVPEACAFLGCGRTWLFAEMKRGVIPYTMVAGQRKIPVRYLREAAAAGLVRRDRAVVSPSKIPAAAGIGAVPVSGGTHDGAAGADTPAARGLRSV